MVSRQPWMRDGRSSRGWDVSRAVAAAADVGEGLVDQVGAAGVGYRLFGWRGGGVAGDYSLRSWCQGIRVSGWRVKAIALRIGVESD